MAETRKALQQASQIWQQLSGKQRLMVLGGGALTAVLLVVLVRQAATPTYKVLFSGLSPADSQSIAAQLDAKNIPHQMDTAGTSISVPAEQLDAARLEVATQGMPDSGRMGFEIFDRTSWGQTEFDEKVNYQRALEGELERTIQGLQAVESARVHLVLPADSVFIDRKRTAKASVILKLRRGALSPDAEVSIARLVAEAVDELSPENVAVIDADTNRRLGTSGTETAAAGSLDEQLTRKLLATLAPIVGADRVRASVNVEHDPSTLEESQEKFDPSATVTLSMQRTQEKIGGGSRSAGVPGTTRNVPGANAGTSASASAEDSGQNNTSESATYGVNKIVRHTSQPAGRIRRITAALVLDDLPDTQQDNGRRTGARRKWSADELNQIKDMAQATLGLDTARGDVVSVQNITFDQPPVQSAPAISQLERIRTLLNDWAVVLRYAVIVLLFLATYRLVIRPIKNQAIVAMKELPAGARLVASAALPDPGVEALEARELQMLERILYEIAHTVHLLEELNDEQTAQLAARRHELSEGAPGAYLIAIEENHQRSQARHRSLREQLAKLEGQRVQQLSRYHAARRNRRTPSELRERQCEAYEVQAERARQQAADDMFLMHLGKNRQSLPPGSGKLCRLCPPMWATQQ